MTQYSITKSLWFLDPIPVLYNYCMIITIILISTHFDLFSQKYYLYHIHIPISICVSLIELDVDSSASSFNETGTGGGKRRQPPSLNNLFQPATKVNKRFNQYLITRTS